MKYTIIIEPTDTGYSASAPDLDGCVAAGGSRNDTIVLMCEVIEFPLKDLAECGETALLPQCESALVEVGRFPNKTM
jgi:predicted RNase H-like HicB family nuclease